MEVDSAWVKMKIPPFRSLLMNRTRRSSNRVADRRPRGGRKIGRARNRLSGKRYGRSSTTSTRTPRHGEFAGENIRHDERKPRRSARSAERPRDTSSNETLPVYIRATGTHFGPDERAYTQRKLHQKLGKFATSIERISVRIDDVNGPRGGVDQACRMKIVMSGQPSVIINTQNAKAHAAVDAAIQGVEKAVRRTVRRRRMKPLRRAA